MWLVAGCEGLGPFLNFPKGVCSFLFAGLQGLIEVICHVVPSTWEGPRLADLDPCGWA